MKIVNLFDICRPTQWKTLSTKDLSDSGYPVYGANGKIGFYPEYNHEYETLLITCRGATCGSMTISEPKSYINGNAMALDDLDTLRVDLRYLFYFFKNRGFSDVISGSAQPQITRQGLQKIQVSLPPLEEQIRIVRELDAADALRQKRKQAIDLLADYLKVVFLEMFGDPVMNPKGWESNFLGKYLKVKHGFAFKSEYFSNKGNYILLTPGSFYEQGGYRDRGEKQKYYIGDVPKVYILTKNDLLVAMTEQAPGLLGSTIFVPESNKFLHNQRLGLIVYNKEKVNRFFIFHLLNHSKIRKIIHSKATGTKVRHTSPSKIEEINIPFPPLSLQNQFATIVEKTESIRQTMIVQTDKLEMNFNVLMQCFFS